tara:strand:- start:1175 stop:1699 length:525 start_codon:yes stop_codon:yes gene_type:complete
MDDNIEQYSWFSKFFHWITFLILIVQIPLGFILVRMEFSDLRITIENLHVVAGITVFYVTLIRLIFKFFSQSPKLLPNAFVGQKLIAKLNHVALYVALLTITTSGILKKLFNGEKLNFFFFKLKINDNFDLADQFYTVHIVSNYTLIILISLHILAVLFHQIFLKENILKRMIK